MDYKSIAEKIIELKNASLERQVKNLNYQNELLKEHINRLENGSNKKAAPVEAACVI